MDPLSPAPRSVEPGRTWLLMVTGLGLLLAILLSVDRAQAQEPVPGPSQSVSGTLEADDEPVSGVVIRVKSGDGVLLGEPETTADGTWRVSVPSAGRYSVELDTATLPEGISLVDPAKDELDVPVRQGQNRVLIFSLQTGSPGTGSSESEEGFDWKRLVSLTVDGIRLGVVLGVMAMGLSLVFGVTGLINFAQGELVTFGAIMAWVFNAGAFNLPLFIAGICALVLAGGLGWGLERGIFRPLRRRHTSNIALIVVTIGLGELLRNLYLITFGPLPRSYRDYAIQREMDLGFLDVTPKSLGIIAVGSLAILLVALLLQRTRLGTAMRAVADNKDLAESSGIDVGRVILHVWILGTVLAALGGILLGITQKVEYDMGFKALLLIFAAVVVGGLGTAYGPILGALLLGIVTQVSTIWFDTEFKFVFALLALVLMLIFRPQGILGRRERVG